MQLPQEMVLDPSLVLYLPLWKQDGAQFSSADVGGRLCTVAGAPAWTARGRKFDGVADAISLSNSGPLLAFTSMTACIWLRTVQKAGISWQEPIDSGYWAAGGLVITQDDGGSIMVPRLKNTLAVAAIGASITFTDNQWLQAGWVWDGANLFSIQNGSLLSAVALGGTVQSDITLYLGRRADAALQFWNGTIAEVLIWNRALTAAEVQNSYLTALDRMPWLARGGV